VRGGGEVHMLGKGEWDSFVYIVDSGEGRDWPGRGERHPGD